MLWYVPRHCASLVLKVKLVIIAIAEVVIMEAGTDCLEVLARASVESLCYYFEP